MKEKVINRKTTIKKEHNWITMKFTGILVIQIKWRGKTYVGVGERIYGRVGERIYIVQ